MTLSEQQERLRCYQQAHDMGVALRIQWDVDEPLVLQGLITETAPSFYTITEKAVEALNEFEGK